MAKRIEQHCEPELLDSSVRPSLGTGFGFPHWPLQEQLPRMPRYYLDLWDDTGLYPDDEGLELASIDAARQEAAHSLADMLRDAVRGGSGRDVRQMSVTVRNDVGPVIRVKSNFEIEGLV
jgi:hypothetical protein